VQVSVSNGWVTLEGAVEGDFQRRAAARSVRDLWGVTGVSNLITIKPSNPADVERRIAEAFRRNAQIDAGHVAVAVSGGRVVLRGSVTSLAEKEAAERAAFAAPGVISVQNDIEVRAHAFT
jgi:osmotically-inducible protein OsmY